jgi:NADPH:quinone reductase-like Zn-dependent oxidoreductase
MKAIVRDTYGPPDVLELRDIDIPELADDEVLVRVHAAGVGRDVWHVMTGLPYPIRLAGYGFRAPKPTNLTFEQAAVLAIMGSTALQTLRDQGKVR